MWSFLERFWTDLTQCAFHLLHCVFVADRDIVTYVLDHLIDSNKTRRQVLRQMIALNILDPDEGKMLSRAPKQPT